MNYVIYAIYVLNMTLLGFTVGTHLGFMNSVYLTSYGNFVHFCIALFLIWKFHPFRKTYVLLKNESDIIFSLSLYIFLFSSYELVKLFPEITNSIHIFLGKKET